MLLMAHPRGQAKYLANRRFCEGEYCFLAVSDGNLSTGEQWGKLGGIGVSSWYCGGARVAP